MCPGWSPDRSSSCPRSVSFQFDNKLFSDFKINVNIEHELYIFLHQSLHCNVTNYGKMYKTIFICEEYCLFAKIKSRTSQLSALFLCLSGTHLNTQFIWSQIITHLNIQFIWSQLSEMALWDQSQRYMFNFWDHINTQFIENL